MTIHRHRAGFDRRAACRAAATILCLASTAATAAGTASSWILSLPDHTRECRLTLRGDADGKGAPVAMPSGCHRAFAALKGVVRWSETGDGRLQLEDAHGAPLLAFDADGTGFAVTTPQGERMELKPATPTSAANLAKAAAAAPPHEDLASTGDKPAAPAKKPVTPNAASGQKPAEVAGRYAVLRDKTRDTGCMVTLDDKASGPGGTLKARLAPACRDQGIVVFDPVGWQLKNGQLVLKARKGHTTELGPQDDGSWINSPKTGKTLSLKKI